MSQSMPPVSPSASGHEPADPDPADAAPSRPRLGRPVRWLTATTLAVAIVLVVAAAAFAVLAFTQNDGAASSEEAARGMLKAVGSNDVVGLVDQLPPGERKALRDSVAPLAPQLQRVGFIGATDPQHVNGPELKFDNVRLRASRMTDDMDAVDLVGGTFTFQVPGGAPPLTDKARRALERSFGITINMSGTTYTRDFGTEPLRLVAIREGGGWHVSLAYTIAEAKLKQHDADRPKMGTGPPAVGAKTPQDAVTDLMTAYADSNAERLVTLMYPEEARALYDYAPAFLPAMHQAALEANAYGTYDVQLNRLTTEVDGTGGVRTVKITGLDVDIRDEVKKAHITYDGRCFHTDWRINDPDAPFFKADHCNGDVPRPEDPSTPRDNPISNLSVFGGGVDPPTFTVIERNGRWFISPARTLLGSFLTTLQQTQPDHHEAIADRFGAAWKAGVGAGTSGRPIRPTPAEVEANPTLARSRAIALAAACTSLGEGVGGEPVTAACLRRLVETRAVNRDDLPTASRQIIG